MHKPLNSFSEQQKCFYNKQYGFRLSLSTTNALMLISEKIQSLQIYQCVTIYMLPLCLGGRVETATNFFKREGEGLDRISIF